MRNISRKRNPNFGNRGLTLIELFIASVATTFLLAGMYKLVTKSTESTTKVIRDTKFERDAAAVQGRLEKMLRNIGFNPTMQAFDLVADEDIVASGENFKYRMGLHRAQYNLLEWGSNDNILTGCAPSGDPTTDECENSHLQPSEHYGLRIAAEPGASTTPLIPLKTRTETSPIVESEMCEPNNANVKFTTEYKLLAKMKDFSAENPLTAPTKETVLADNVLCLEFRYYREGDPTACPDLMTYTCPETPSWEDPCLKQEVTDPTCIKEPDWVRVRPSDVTFWAYSAIMNANNDRYRLPEWKTDSTFEEKKYYTILREIGKVKVAVLFANRPGSSETINRITGDKRATKKIEFTVSLANRPWPRDLTAQLQSGYCDSNGLGVNGGYCPDFDQDGSNLPDPPPGPPLAGGGIPGSGGSPIMAKTGNGAASTAEPGIQDDAQ